MTALNVSPSSTRFFSSLALAMIERNWCSKLLAVRVPSTAYIIAYVSLATLGWDIRRTATQSAEIIFWPLSAVAFAILNEAMVDASCNAKMEWCCEEKVEKGKVKAGIERGSVAAQQDLVAA